MDTDMTPGKAGSAEAQFRQVGGEGMVFACCLWVWGGVQMG